MLIKQTAPKGSGRQIKAKIVDVKMANKDQALGCIPAGTGIIQIQTPIRMGTKKRHNFVMVISLKLDIENRNSLEEYLC